jgi:hypothetical protein
MEEDVAASDDCARNSTATQQSKEAFALQLTKFVFIRTSENAGGKRSSRAIMVDFCEILVTQERRNAGTTSQPTQSRLCYRGLVSIDRIDCNAATLQ